MRALTERRKRVSNGTGPNAKRKLEQQAFTMLEIALSLAVIAFAVVAIIGILPAGLTVQKENREDTIINQDGPYLLEAIRNGTTNLEEIVEHVNLDHLAVIYYDIADQTAPGTFRTNFVTINNPNEEILGYLALPRGTSDPDSPSSNFKVHRVEAEVTAFSGVAVEHSHPSPEISFNYLLVSEVVPFENSLEAWETNSVRVQNVRSNLFDLRLTLRWPLIVSGAGGNTSFRVPGGGSRKTFRTLISGAPRQTNSLFYFKPGRFVQAAKE